MDEMPSHSRSADEKIDIIVDDDLIHPDPNSICHQQENHSHIDHVRSRDEGERSEIDRNSSPDFSDSHEVVGHQEVVSVTGNENELISLNSPNEEIQVITNSGITTVTDNNGAIYLLVSNDTPGNIVHTSQETNVNIISSDTLKGIEPTSTSTVQIMDTEGIPVSINVNDLLSTINASKAPPLKETSSTTSTSGSMLNFSSITPSSGNSHITNEQDVGVVQPSNTYAIQNDNRLSSIPNWALHLHNCTLYGDTYTGYVTDEIEMDNALNLYKKETQSLFAIRQTPSPSKDESTDTVRLMWKSQYVPYDGIPFVNVGRRATVMECEYGPRKRNNALKRMIQLHGHEKAIAKIPNLTCPARLFVKKVRKFPQFRVPSDADPKVLRQLQEQSLKLVRQHGLEAGEIRFYMQLPLPIAHRYHHVGNSLEMFQKEIENSDDVLSDSLSVDSRVLEKIQEIVRQGFVNPFLVRAAAKDFVENQMEVGSLESLPHKHNKEFYPPLIEIQNIIQQTQAALNSGLLTPLPAPTVPPVAAKPKRKRSSTGELLHSSLLMKKMPVDNKTESDGMVSPTIPSVPRPKNILNDSMISAADAETISLTLTDSQLENFSLTNFTYSQLAQLAKIGLIALNNATKDSTQIGGVDGDEIGLKSICDKDITLVNGPLPDCEPNQPLLVNVNENISVKDEKIGILTEMNELSTNEITADVQYK